MEVEFCRTGERRYSVRVIRPGLPVLEMNPAPGYDARMPHDLLHFVVECELGLRDGIFGQLAAGGTAGTFHSAADGVATGRQAARQRRALAARGAKLLKQGREDSETSERAAELALRAWTARAAGGQTPTEEAQAFATVDIARICEVLDEVSAAWAALGTGQALTLRWPVAGRGSRRSAGVRPN